MMNKKKYPESKKKEYWEKTLTKFEFEILINKGTERAFSGKYNDHYEKGIYRCKACGNNLYESDSKFNSGCGWPSYDKNIKNSVSFEEDNSFGMKRIEILCSNCGGHLGHIFNDGPTETKKRHCVNSASIKFEPEK
jgi:peptide-methionine (R)-S-oxide reductase